MQDADTRLLELAVAGDSSALRELLERHGTQARRAVRTKIPRWWRSMLNEDDVMQVTYLEAFLHIENLAARDTAGFVAWLCRIAENALCDALRGLERQKRPQPHRRVELPVGLDSYVGLLEELGATTTTPSRTVAADEAARAVNEALDSLPPDYRRVIQLYDLEQRPAPDVAHTMGRSVGAVYMLRARACEKLRVNLGDASRFFSDRA